MPTCKKILLINPPNVRHMQGNLTHIPLGLLYLVAYLRKKNVCVDMIDGSINKEDIENKITNFQPDLVGVSCLTLTRHDSLKIAILAKKIIPSCKVVFGGIHPTLMWQQIMNHYPQVDFIVRGEGEVTLSELAVGVKPSEINGLVWRRINGEVVCNKNRELIAGLDQIPFPAWDITNPTKYPPYGSGVFNGVNLKKEPRFSVIFSRGCMGHCTFCSSWKIWRGYRFRSAKNVIEEMEFLIKKYDAKHFVFEDDTLTGNKVEIMKLCKEIIKGELKVAINGMTRVDCVDEELLIWMKKAGFYGLSYGIESGSPAMLLKMNKKTNLDKIIRAAKLTRRAGIKFCAFMMYGMPLETKEDRSLSSVLLKKIRPDYINSMGEVWIFPGTTLYELAKSAKIIDDKYWLSKNPYYIYRGGIGTDPINHLLKIKDFITFLVYGTRLERAVFQFFIKLKKLNKIINSIFFNFSKKTILENRRLLKLLNN